MDKIAGIIAEYNPFHNGHALQIKKIKQQLGDIPVIVVMSGHFLQRGQATIVDKWTRAQTAIANGADLIFELPFIHSCRSAEFFARGGVQILNATQIVTHICFGIEAENTTLLDKVAQLTTTPQFISAIKDCMKNGHTYAKAMQITLDDSINIPNDILRGPNNILAIEYLKALKATNSTIQPLGIKREGAQHLENQITNCIASATSIRQELKQNGFSDKVLATLPQNSHAILLEKYQQKQLLLDDKTFEKLLFYRLRQLTTAQMLQIADISEGLEYKIKQSAHNTNSLEKLIADISSKRYPKTRIMRILCQLLVVNTDILKQENSPYLRILAFSSTGRKLIKKIRSKTVFPLITNLPDFQSEKTAFDITESLNADINATDIFQLLLNTNTAGLDYKLKPTYIT